MPRRRSEEQIEQLVEQYRARGLSQVECSRQTGVVLSTLGRYLRRHTTPEQRLVRVKLEPASEPAAGFALVLANGRRIEAGWRYTDTELARLIRVAEGS
jgi:hypothetical protein